RNLSRRPGERLFDHLYAVPLVLVFALQLVQGPAGTQQSDTTPGENALLNRGAGRMHGVVNAILALFHLDLGGAPDPDHCNAARELRQPFLQLLTIVVGSGFLDLRLDLSYTSLNIVLLAGTTHDRGVFLLDGHLLGTAKHIDRHVLKLGTEISRDHGAASQDRDILQHRLASVAEARRLHGHNLEPAPKLVHDKRCECLAFDIFCYDEEWLAGLHHRLKER